MRLDQGMNEGPNAWLERISKMYHGIPYGGRPLWEQSAHMSRGSHVPSRSTGKQYTGQRSTGT